MSRAPCGCTAPRSPFIYEPSNRRRLYEPSYRGRIREPSLSRGPQPRGRLSERFYQPQYKPIHVREQSAPQRPRETKPIVLRGKSERAQCRPFIKIEKDASLFAACNALADELGPINTPEKAFELISEAIGDELNEVFGVVTLDLHLRFKSLGETGRGEPSSVMAPLVPTLQTAVADGAHTAIIFHVHPSGVEAEPSDADIETTDQFVDGFDAVGIPLMDHIIVGGDNSRRSYYSFAESGDL